MGVLTEIKIRSASCIAVSISVEKNRFLPRHSLTTSTRDGYKIRIIRNATLSLHASYTIVMTKDFFIATVGVLGFFFVFFLFFWGGAAKIHSNFCYIFSHF